MQRRNAGVEVKQVIGSLCSLLAATGHGAVPAPETFRRAKFGAGPDVEDQFWLLLSNILQTAGIVSFDAQTQLKEEHRKVVVEGLWQTGYHADWMYAGDGATTSSKELLLGLGWLLATGILEKLVTQRVLQLDKTLLTTVPVNPSQLTNELQMDTASLRKIQWLICCLRCEQRILLSMLEERTRLLHAVFFTILPFPVSSFDHNSPLLTEDCFRMQQLCDLLKAYLNWKQVENIFWTWMASVVEGHHTDPFEIKPTNAPNGTGKCCHHGSQRLKKLDDRLLRLSTGQVCNTHKKRHRKGKWDSMHRGEGGERLQAELNTSSLSDHSSLLPSLASLPQVFRARLQAVPVMHGSHPVEGSCSSAESPHELPSSQAVQFLLQTEAMLLERRDRQRLANKIQLQEIFSRHDKLILIAP